MPLSGTSRSGNTSETEDDDTRHCTHNETKGPCEVWHIKAEDGCEKAGGSFSCANSDRGLGAEKDRLCQTKRPGGLFDSHHRRDSPSKITHAPSSRRNLPWQTIVDVKQSITRVPCAATDGWLLRACGQFSRTCARGPTSKTI